MDNYKINNNLLTKLSLILLIIGSILVNLLFIYLSKSKILALIIILLSFIIIWKNSNFGFYLIAFFLPFMALKNIFRINLDLIEPLIFIILSIFCIKSLKKKSFIELKKTKFDLAILFFLFITFIIGIEILLQSLNKTQLGYLSFSSPLYITRTIFVTFESVLLFFLTLNLLPTNKITNIAKIFLLSASLSALYGVFQFIFLGAQRINAFFDHPNSLAMFLIMVFPLAIYFSIKKKKWWWIVSILLFLTLILTFSRGAWLGFLGSLIFLGTLSKIKRKWKIILFSILLISLLALLSFFIYVDNAYEQIEITVNSSKWQNYNISVEDKRILKIRFINDYYNETTKENRNLYISNITNIKSPIKLIKPNQISDCDNYCEIIHVSVLYAITNQNFSISLKADYGKGWPRALITLEKDNFYKKMRSLFWFRRLVELSSGNGLGGRIKFWKKCIGEIKNNPLLGNGHKFLILPYNNIAEHAHNLYIQLIFERGIFCLLAFLWILMLFFKDIKKYNGFSLAIAAGIFAFLIHGLFDYSLKIGLLFFFYLAILFKVK